MTWFQWDNGNLEATTCEPLRPCTSLRRAVKVYWAWDRSIGGWVHYRA